MSPKCPRHPPGAGKGRGCRGPPPGGGRGPRMPGPPTSRPPAPRPPRLSPTCFWPDAAPQGGSLSFLPPLLPFTLPHSLHLLFTNTYDFQRDYVVEVISLRVRGSGQGCDYAHRGQQSLRGRGTHVTTAWQTPEGQRLAEGARRPEGTTPPQRGTDGQGRGPLDSVSSSTPSTCSEWRGTAFQCAVMSTLRKMISSL